MNILIAGCNGNIGSYLFNELKTIYYVIGLGKKKNPKAQNYFSVDLTSQLNTDNLISKMPKIDTLIFLVGLAHKKGKGKDFLEFQKVNIDTLVNLTSALEQHQKTPDKIIFASTISVYGEKKYITNYDENYLPDPKSPYAITKLEAESFLLKYYPNKTWVLRFSPVYGRNFMLNIYRRIKIGNTFFRVGDGENKLSLCNIKNIKIVVENIIEHNIPYGIYNISDSKLYTYNSLLKKYNNIVLNIPNVLAKILYFIGLLFRNIFLIENTIKLISNNIFPSDKVCKYINLPHNFKSIDDI